MENLPNFCRPLAYEHFCRQLDSLDATANLVQAAVAIAMHELEGINPDEVLGRVNKLAARVGGRVHSGSQEALLAHLHDVLFVEEGFAGNTDHYYAAENSYLPIVLQTKRGLPIILSLIYKAVAEGVGLQVEGINSPGHFLVRVRTGADWMLVDPFFHGQSLTREEAFKRLEQVGGREMPRDDQLLPPATHHQWLARALANLQSLFANQARQDDLAAMTELQEALAETFY
ncbi:MAG TPA: transglutaminase-like domain-containing protein [Pirellulaceae bacterium]|jgi:regulator of sirC expression with transglutaminase-like and TPR domain|nr:transglutaminase-like domain-containing protein [Pirellulaceae bacterium]